MYFDENRDSISEPDMIETVYPFLKWGIIVINISRIILVLLSVNDFRVCKTYLYIQQFYVLLEYNLPRNYGSIKADYFTNADVITFTLLYFKNDFWPNSIVMIARRIT